MTEDHENGYLAQQPPAEIRARALRVPNRRLPDHLRNASGAQLHRLNTEGVLRLEMPETLPPGRPDDVAPIARDEAKAALGRLADERWTGVGFPAAGVAWRVEDGRVVLLGRARDEEPRT